MQFSNKIREKLLDKLQYDLRNVRLELENIALDKNNLFLESDDFSTTLKDPNLGIMNSWILKLESQKNLLFKYKTYYLFRFFNLLNFTQKSNRFNIQSFNSKKNDYQKSRIIDFIFKQNEVIFFYRDFDQNLKRKILPFPELDKTEIQCLIKQQAWTDLSMVLTTIIDDYFKLIDNLLLYFSNFTSRNQTIIPIEYRQTRLIPRSIPRTIERFMDELKLTAEDRYLNEFKLSRQQIWIASRAFFIFLILPLLITQVLKSVFFEPFIYYTWNQYHPNFFLNSQQEQKALNELKNFEDQIYFEELVRFLDNSEKLLGTTEVNFEFEKTKKLKSLENNNIKLKFFPPMENWHPRHSHAENWHPLSEYGEPPISENSKNPDQILNRSNYNDVNSLKEDEILSFAKEIYPLSEAKAKIKVQQLNPFYSELNILNSALEPVSQNQQIEPQMILIAKKYNQESIHSVSNLLGDCCCFLLTIFFLSIYKREVIILKAFFSEVLYSLSDTTKSFFIILLTDLLVGFHSPKGWEIFIQATIDHFIIPKNEDFVFLCVATFPVLLDTAFKYWIFRYLNRLSPSTVVTYHNMIE